MLSRGITKEKKTPSYALWAWIAALSILHLEDTVEHLVFSFFDSWPICGDGRYYENSTSYIRICTVFCIRFTEPYESVLLKVEHNLWYLKRKDSLRSFGIINIVNISICVFTAKDARSWIDFFSPEILVWNFLFFIEKF